MQSTDCTFPFGIISQSYKNNIHPLFEHRTTQTNPNRYCHVVDECQQIWYNYLNEKEGMVLTMKKRILAMILLIALMLSASASAQSFVKLGETPIYENYYGDAKKLDPHDNEIYGNSEIISSDEKTPSDGLCGSTDEQKLGFSYAVLDRYIREGFCEDPVIREKIDELHRRNKFKMETMEAFPSGLEELPW